MMMFRICWDKIFKQDGWGMGGGIEGRPKAYETMLLLIALIILHATHEKLNKFKVMQKADQSHIFSPYD